MKEAFFSNNHCCWPLMSLRMNAWLAICPNPSLSNIYLDMKNTIYKAETN